MSLTPLLGPPAINPYFAANTLSEFSFLNCRYMSKLCLVTLPLENWSRTATQRSFLGDGNTPLLDLFISECSVGENSSSHLFMECKFFWVCVIFQHKVLKREMLWLKPWEGQGEEGRGAHPQLCPYPKHSPCGISKGT